MDRSDYPENLDAYRRTGGSVLDHVVWTEGGLTLTRILIDHQLPTSFRRMMPPSFNGYVRFPIAPFDNTYEGMRNHILVHGGITYVQEHEDGSGAYGFDTNHFGDPQIPELKDPDHITGEIRYLAQMIALAVPFEYALRRLGGAHEWSEDRSGEETQILDSYRAAAAYLDATIDVTQPLPPDFWERTRQHPLFDAREDFHGRDDPGAGRGATHQGRA